MSSLQISYVVLYTGHAFSSFLSDCRSTAPPLPPPPHLPAGPRISLCWNSFHIWMSRWVCCLCVKGISMQKCMRTELICYCRKMTSNHLFLSPPPSVSTLHLALASIYLGHQPIYLPDFFSTTICFDYFLVTVCFVVVCFFFYFLLFIFFYCYVFIYC